MRGRIVQINIGNGGVPKLETDRCEVTADGLAGDRQAKPGIHGGIWKAVSLFSMEAIGRLASEGHSVVPGSLGENVTLCGIDWSILVPGANLRLGADVELVIASYATPCDSIRHGFSDGDLMHVHHKFRDSRLYARVLSPGWIAIDDFVRVRPHGSQAETI